MSRPARALWIEILCEFVGVNEVKSRPARALWIEMLVYSMQQAITKKSRPARALWIEIRKEKIWTLQHWEVEAREGLVD